MELPIADIKDTIVINIFFISGKAYKIRILRTQWDNMHRKFYNMDMRVIEADPYRTTYPISIGTYNEDGTWLVTVYINLMHIFPDLSCVISLY